MLSATILSNDFIVSSILLAFFLAAERVGVMEHLELELHPLCYPYYLFLKVMLWKESVLECYFLLDRKVRFIIFGVRHHFQKSDFHSWQIDEMVNVANTSALDNGSAFTGGFLTPSGEGLGAGDWSPV